MMADTALLDFTFPSLSDHISPLFPPSILTAFTISKILWATFEQRVLHMFLLLLSILFLQTMLYFTNFGFLPSFKLRDFLSSYSFLHFSPQHLFNIWFIILLCLFILFTVFLHPLQNKHQWKDFFLSLLFYELLAIYLAHSRH